MSSTFFNEHPIIDYEIDGIKHSITNINIAHRLIMTAQSNKWLFTNYIIADHETPESIADKIYSNYSYYWTILLVNNIVNPFTDWVKSGVPFYNWCVVKYQNELDGIYGIHHFVDVNTGDIVDDYHDKLFRQLGAGNYPDEYRPISNLEYEEIKNNERRFIKLIDNAYIKDFVRQVSKTLNSL